MAITISGENNNDRILASDGVIDQLSGFNVVGVMTATSFTGDLTGNVTGNVTGNLTGNVNSTSNLLLQIGGSEKFRVGGSGQLGIGGANYGTSGQVLTSGGSGSAVSWATPTVTGFTNGSNNRVVTATSGSGLNGEANLTYDGSSLKLTNTPSGYTSGALKINTDFANYGHIQVRDKNQYQTAALNVENENDGTDETCYIYRAVDLASSAWANARMGAKSHSFQTSSDTLGANRRLLVDIDGIRVDGRVSGSTQVSGIRVNTDYLNYGVVTARDASNSDQSNHIACFQAENGGTGSDETNIVTRSVNRSSQQWANAKYAAKSHIWTTTGSVDANIRLRITSGGDVNITGGNLHVGTDSATANFTDSNGGNTKHIEIGATGGGDALLTTHSSGYGIGYFGYEAGGDRLVIACDGGSGNNKIDFITDAGTSTGGGTDNLNAKVPKVRITAAGKVGINETSPDSLLHLTTNDSTAYNTSTVNTSNQTNALLRLENTNGSDGSGVNNYVGIYFRVVR